MVDIKVQQGSIQHNHVVVRDLQTKVQTSFPFYIKMEHLD